MKVALTADQWNTVITTTVDTVIQNRSQWPVEIATEDTSSLDRDEGLELQHGDAVVVGPGLDVEAYIVGRAGLVTVVELGVAA